MFSCSKIEQKQLNTWVSFQSAEQPLLGQFSVSGNNSEIIDRLALSIERDEQGDLTVRALAQVTRRCEELEQELAELKAALANETSKPALQQAPRLSIASAQ
uniref:Transcriptional regulator n=1 Tax=Pseudomonas aeruginosa TaxID=287 RepID=A0A3G1DGM7_PSEAI|nr:hypothetical protein [Pseudomonas aeruginosa]AMP35802.1 Transcriptional regulator [Pseudomonas aeruginosa]